MGRGAQSEPIVSSPCSSRPAEPLPLPSATQHPEPPSPLPASPHYQLSTMASQMFDPINMDMESKTPVQTVGTAPDLPDPAAPPGSAPAIKRRAPIACRRYVPIVPRAHCELPPLIAAILTVFAKCRCRRMRSKCLHDKAKPPCQACSEAGLGPEAWYNFPPSSQPYPTHSLY